MYDVIVEAVPAEDEHPFPWRKLCWKAILAKISTFSWKIVCERLATKDNLLKRGICDGMGTGVCSMCLSPMTSSNHVLFSCSVALLVWQAICIWLDKSLLYSLVARDHFVEFVESKNGNVKRKLLGLIWQTTIWKIWKVCNGLIFKDISYTLNDLINDIKFCSWKQIHAHYPLSFVCQFYIWDSQPLECISIKL